MEQDVVLKVNQSKVAHELFDDEVIAVNLDTGSYFSLDRSAAFIWKILVQGAAPAQVARQVAARYSGDADAMAKSVEQFLSELERESLLVCVPGETEAAGSAVPAGGKIPYESPVLQKYTDMEELLLIDPIHEVDEMGWPSARPVEGA
ncbi:MAG: PqqD family protein [Chloroflexi bacterium]|nr:PqqD family protein [Chloroflexota bacterium]